MTVPPLVSIITPVYNGRQFIGDAIECCLRQTYSNWELLIADDCSSDDTCRIVESYFPAAGGRLKLLRNSRNLGCGASRNNAIRQSNGEWIALLDVDDVWDSTKLKKQLSVSRSNPRAGLIYCHCEFVDEAGRVIENYPRANRSYRGWSVEKIFSELFLIPSGVIFKRGLIDQVGLFKPQLRVGEDYEFFLRALAHTEIDLVEEKLYKRRVVSSSLSRRSFIEDWETDIENLKAFVKTNPSLFRSKSKLVRKRIGELHFDIGYHSLENGFRSAAVRHLVAAMRYEPSSRVLKSLCLCWAPFGWAITLKKMYRGLQ